MRTTKVKVRLGTGNYHDWGCRIICKCGRKIYFNKTDFADMNIFTCKDCDRPILVCNDGVPYYIGEAVFPKEQTWGE